MQGVSSALTSALLFAGFLSTSTVALAQTYPVKPVRFIVPFPPGGGLDVVARTVGQKLSETIGQQVVIDNRAGAGGIIGSELASNSAPDGYTILMCNIGTFAFNASIYAKLPYDPIKDFAPVFLVAEAQNLFLVHPSMPVKTVKEFIVIAKSKPGQLNFASGGSGGTSHIAPEMLKLLAKIDMVHVPYKGAAPALIDLVAGNVHMMITNMPAAMPHVQSGRLKALAVTGSKRSALVPHLPTVTESGVPGYEMSGWFGIVAPANTPNGTITRLNEAIVRGAQTKEMRDRLAASGAEPVATTPHEFAMHIKAEMGKWRKIITGAGIKAN